MLSIHSGYFKVLKNGKLFPFCPDGLPLKSENVFLSFIQKGLDIEMGSFTVWMRIDLMRNLSQD
jgi:hypothetical protein